MNLRLATFADEKLLFDWRNDPDVIACTSDTMPLSEDRHHRWLAMVLADRDTFHLFIAEVDGVPVGQGRIERAWKAISRKMDAAMISYSIAREYRGRGYGKQLVIKLVHLAKEQYGFATVGCRIKRTNVRSVHAAMLSGINAIEFF